MRKYNVLIVVDAQNDFITGALANPEADKRVPNIVNLIYDYPWDLIVTTSDTHYEDYLSTNEGKKLPVPHCISGTPGHDLDPRVVEALEDLNPEVTRTINITKGTFGSKTLVDTICDITEFYPGDEMNIVFCGFCTDICVVSNALNVKMHFANTADIYVAENACAGVTKESHDAAILTMQMCQIDIFEPTKLS